MAKTFPFNAASGGSGGVLPDPKKAASASSALDLLEVGSVYTGKVRALSSKNTYDIEVLAPSCRVSDARLASGIIGGLLGFNDSRVLPVGTEVMLVYGNPAVILVTLPSGLPDAPNGGSRSVSWGDSVGSMEAAGQFGSSSIPEDMVAGEFDFDNLFGVGLRFLTSLIAMKAGDRAKVECHLLNDMVRVVSQQFRHIHGMGEELIFDHGRPTSETGYSSYRHELMGRMKESAALFEMNGDEVDKTSIDRVNAVARHRYLEYLGFAGDFIHKFVCDPPAVLVDMAGVALMKNVNDGRRAGKAWEHIGSDGSYIIQSTSEIRLERVTRIPVPHRIASHEDPQVTKDRRYRELDKEFLKVWDYGSIEDKDAYRTTYQLRQYARWLTRFQAFARMLQLDHDYDLKSEDSYPAPDWNNLEEDRKSASPDMEYFEAYSSYTILRDGSQILHDGYGSGVVLSNGNVQLSASRHLELEAAGDIRLSCSSFFLKARRHVEISASAGGIILHCYALFRALCEKGSIHLRSDAKTTDDEADESKDVTPEIAPVVLDSAILLETGKGKFAVRSEKQVSITVEGAPDDPDDRTESSADIVLSTRGSLRVRSQKYIILGSLKDTIMSARNIATKASKWYGDLGEVLWDKFWLSPKSGAMQARRLELASLDAQSGITGPERGPLPMKNSPDVNAKSHSNHIGVRKDVDIRWKDAEEKSEEAQDSLEFAPDAKLKPITPWELGAKDAPWEFLSPDDYYWDVREETKGALVQSLTQQYIAADSPEFWGQGDDQYESWSWGGDRLTISGRVGDNKVGFGGKALQYVATGGENLHEHSSLSPDAIGNYATSRSWTTRAVTMRLLKHS